VPSEINWNTALGEKCTNKVHNFLTKVEQVCRNTHPIKNFKSKSKCIPRESSRTHEKKNSNNALKLSTTRVNTKTLHDVEIKILTLFRKQQEEIAITAIKENPKFFYKYAAKYSKTKSNISPLIDEQGQSVHEPKEIAETLRLHYESIFSQPDREKKILTLQKHLIRLIMGSYAIN